MCWKLHELHKYAVKNMYTLPVYMHALNFEIRSFQYADIVVYGIPLSCSMTSYDIMRLSLSTHHYQCSCHSILGMPTGGLVWWCRHHYYHFVLKHPCSPCTLLSALCFYCTICFGYVVLNRGKHAVQMTKTLHCHIFMCTCKVHMISKTHMIMQRPHDQ